MEKIKVWKCSECGDRPPCFAVNIQSNGEFVSPRKCLAIHTDDYPNWQPTDEYEIVKSKIKAAGLKTAVKNIEYRTLFCDDLEKEKGLTPGELKEKDPELYKKLYGEAKTIEDYPELYEAVTKPQVPNCAICKWLDSCGDKTKFCHCSAQGEKLCYEAYNTDECKALFEQKETENHE